MSPKQVKDAFVETLTSDISVTLDLWGLHNMSGNMVTRFKAGHLV